MYEELLDVLTGVLIDRNSRLIRMTCFGIIFVGILLSGGILFRTWRLLNTREVLQTEPGQFQQDTEFSRMTQAVQKILEMRTGSEAIARQIAQINSRPFNVGEVGEILTEPQEHEQPPVSIPELTVQAVLSSKKGSYAVIKLGDEKGLIVRRGDVLPRDEGRVTKIHSDGISVLKGNEEFRFVISRSERPKGVRVLEPHR